MSKLEELLKTEMTRKQFLMTLGGLIVSFFGFSSIMGILTKNTPDTNGVVDYGMHNYGP